VVFDWVRLPNCSIRYPGFKKPVSIDTAFDCDFLHVIVDFVDVHYNGIKIDQY